MFLHYFRTLQEALRCNEPIKVYRQMALNFEKNGKIDEAESLYNTMQKKFKDDKSVWLNACLFYIKNAKLSTARNVFQKALLSLEKRERKLMMIIVIMKTPLHARRLPFLSFSLSLSLSLSLLFISFTFQQSFAFKTVFPKNFQQQRRWIELVIAHL